MTEYLKKYWYVILVSIIFVVGIIAVIVTGQEGKVATKQEDGHYVVSSIDGHKITADELYEETKDQLEVPLAAMIFEKEVLERTYEYNEDQKIEAKLEGDQTIAYYKSMFGEDKAEEIINSQLQAMGYDADATLVDYYLNVAATDKLMNDYFTENLEEKFMEDQQFRYASHILVKFSDDANLSAEEKEAEAQAKMAEIDKALETAEFAEVAKEHSVDGSAVNGGDLGLVYKDINFDADFLKATLGQEVGKIGEWVKSQFGYHKILVTSDDLEKIKADQTYQQLLQQEIQSGRGPAFFGLAEKLNIDFSENPEFEAALKLHYGMGGQQ